MESELNGNQQPSPPDPDPSAAEPNTPVPEPDQDDTTETPAENDADSQPGMESADAQPGDQEEPAENPAPSDQAALDDAADDAGESQSTEPDGPPPEVTTEQVVEAVLFGADTPLTAAKIVSIIGTGSARDIRRHIETLNQRYAETGASFRIEKIAGGYQMLTLPAFNPWLKRLKQTRQESKLSQAALETLAVVAYKQPVVRAEIEAIRGVSAGEMLNRLRELGLIKIVGRAEDVGRPLLYGTTKRFLDVFGLGSLDDLPMVEELKAPE